MPASSPPAAAASPVRRGRAPRVALLAAVAFGAAACGPDSTSPAPGSPDPGQNRRPLAEAAIPALDLPLRQLANVDAASYFSDPDGDALAFAARSADPGVARVSVAESVVTLEGAGRGVTEVAVTATDPGGLSASQRFEVNVGAGLALAFGAARGREGGSAFVGLALGEPAAAPLVVRYALGPDDSHLTDDADADDFVARDSGVVVVPAGASEARIEIEIAQDDRIEPPREVSVLALARPAAGSGYVLGSPSTAVVVIREGVCDRTPAVRDGIVEALRVASCTDPDGQDLAGLAALGLERAVGDPVSAPGDLLTALQADDLRYLSGLEWLSLAGQRLTRLPEGVFSDLTSLEVLNLAGNQLAALPPDAFAGLRRLQWLSLFDNRLRALPPQVFGGLAALRELYLGDNELTALPEGVFSRLWSLERVGLAGNAVTFALTVELARVDDGGAAGGRATGPGTAAGRGGRGGGGAVTLAARLAEGAPFTLSLPLWASRGSLSGDSVRLEAGQRESATVTLVPDDDADGPVSVTLGTPTALSEACLDRCDGFNVVAGDPLVVENPETVEISVPVAYLTQATQTRDGAVPLVAGRRALLRVFATADAVNSFRPDGRAIFLRGDDEIHRAPLLSPPGGIPREVDESRLDRSFNAVIPGDVVAPGVSLVVEFDSAAAAPLAPSSRPRFPEEGRHALDVREVPPLRVTLVPVQYLSEANRDANEAVAEFAADLAAAGRGHGSPAAAGVLRHARTVLPLRDLEVALREPYLTSADTAAGGVPALLSEIELLRTMEAGDADGHYTGIFRVPSPYSRHPDAYWTDGLGMLPGRSTLTASHDAEGRLQKPSRLQLVFAHELGHNLGRPHTPCDNPVAHPGDVDADYPHPSGTIGAWGHDFGDADGGGGRGGTGGAADADLGHLFEPNRYLDLMSYCYPQWISDYTFTKMLDVRLGTGTVSANALPADALPAESGIKLLLWGSVADGVPRLEPAFAHPAPTRLPPAPGPYRLSGLDAAGRHLFSLSFSPTPIADGGAVFAFAIPFDPTWTEALDRLTLTGPAGSTSVNRTQGASAALLLNPTTGRVRGILRDDSGALPLMSNAAAAPAPSRVPGLPRHPR